MCIECEEEVRIEVDFYVLCWSGVEWSGVEE